MQELTKLKCVACRGGEPTVTDAEIAELKPQIPEWQIVERENEKRLERIFKFKNFAEALAFTNKVGQIAEAEEHHPAILTEWGKVTVMNWSQSARRPVLSPI